MKKMDVNAAAAIMGRKGAKARIEKTTPEQRTKIAKKAAKARWKNKVVSG